MMSVITSSKNLSFEESLKISDYYKKIYEAGIDFEWIIQDCDSNNNVINYLANLPFVKIKSEKDNGIYQGWNRALKRSSGNKICFLGMDDIPSIDWFFFCQNYSLSGKEALSTDVYICKNGNIIGIHKNLQKGLQNICSVPLVPPGLVFSKDIFVNKNFIETYRIISDGLFYASLIDINVVEKFTQVGVKMEVGGTSNKAIGTRKRLFEFILAFKNRDIPFNTKNFNNLILYHLPSFFLSFIPFGFYEKIQEIKWKLTLRNEKL